MKKLKITLVFVIISVVAIFASACQYDKSKIENATDTNNTDVSAKFEILSHEIENDNYGFYYVTYTIQNVSDETLVFRGISIKEFDSDNTVLNDYYSYNQREIATEMESKQKLKVKLSFSYNDNIAKIESSKYVFDSDSEQFCNEYFKNKYIVEINN